MFKKYMCLALCLLLALGTMSTTASAASSADALVASHVSFSDSTGVISDLPESESTVTASVTVSNNSSKASSVVLWVGKFVDDVLTDVTYVEHPLAGNEQNAVVSASLDNVKKEQATAADGTTYNKTVVKAFVWTAMIGGKALAPVASLPSDNLDIVAVKKDGEIWKDFDAATTNYDLTITKMDPIPEFEFIVADNATKVEMPDEFVIGANTVKLTSAAGTEKEYTINLIDGFTGNDGIFSDDFESYGGTMDTSKWSGAEGYIKNLNLVEEEDGNTYVSFFADGSQGWPRLDTNNGFGSIDTERTVVFSGRVMVHDSTTKPTYTLELRRKDNNKDFAAGLLTIGTTGIKLGGQNIGSATSDNWISFKVSLTLDSTKETANAISVELTGDGLKDTSGASVPSINASGTINLSKIDIYNQKAMHFVCNTSVGASKSDATVNFDDIVVEYGPYSDATLQSLKYTADGVTREVTDFVPGAQPPADGYRAYVPEGTTSVTLEPVATVAQGTTKAEIYVGGVLSPDGSVAIAGEQTEATVKVTAEDGTTTADYKVVIVIGDPVASTNTSLSALTYAIGGENPTTVPGFDPADATDEERTYSVMLPVGTASVTLGVEPVNANATYQIFYKNGNELGDEIADGVVDLTKGTSAAIVVTPEDTGAAKGTFTIDFAINTGIYLLDESNGAVQSDKSGIEFKTAVLGAGSATYDYADGFVIGGVGGSENRNSEYVLNGEGKNMGYTWTLSSKDYAPGTYNVYVKGSGYGSNGTDSFYFAYNEKEMDMDSGLTFKAPPAANPTGVTYEMVALNWVKGQKTITIPADGSVTLRILGREGGAFVDKVILIDTSVSKTVEDAEAEISPLYDAVFTSESGETLATVKYGSDVVGTAVPTEGTYLDGDNVLQTGTINALIVPEKEGLTGSWSPAVLQENGTTFVPVYEDVNKDRVIDMKTVATAGVYTENDGYYEGEDMQAPKLSGKYAVMDGLIPGTTSRYTSDGDTARVVNQSTSSYFEGATVIRGDRNDRTASPAGNWANRPYFVGTKDNPNAYNGKDDNGYWLEFTVTSACTVFQTLVGPGDSIGIWPNAPEDWKQNTKSTFKLDNTSSFYYKHYEAGETVRIPSFGKSDTWVGMDGAETERTAWYEAPTWYIVWDSTGKMNPAEASDDAKLASLQYTVSGGSAETVTGFDPTNEGGSYSLSLPEGTTSVTITAKEAATGTTTPVIKVGDTVVEDGVIDLTSGAAVVDIYVKAQSGLKENRFTINITVKGAEIENQVLELKESEAPSNINDQMKAVTLEFGVTSPYLGYSVGETNNKDGSNPGAAVYTAENSPAFFDGATAIRRNKYDSNGSNNKEAATAKWWGKEAYNGKDGNGYYFTFKVSSDATVYVVDREGKGWPNKPDGWQSSKYTVGSKNMFYKTYTAGSLVEIPNYGWDNSWTTLETGKAFMDPSYYVVVWGECPETSEPEPTGTVIIDEDFEDYELNTEIAKEVKGWDTVNKAGNFIAIANPAGGQMAEVKATDGEKFPALHKNINDVGQILKDYESVAVSGKVQIKNSETTKPSHYIELRKAVGDTAATRQTVFTITSEQIEFFSTKEQPNVIASVEPGTWVNYTLYIVPGNPIDSDDSTTDEETRFVLEVTGDGLKDSAGTPTDKIVAEKTVALEKVGIATENKFKVVFNNGMKSVDEARVYLDDLKIYGADLPEVEPEPEENAKLSALTYAPNGENPQAVPGFSATDEGKPEGYAPIELPYGTTSVTVGATKADDKASVTISPENPIAVSSAAPTEVTVTVTNGKTTNTFKLTFTVAAEEPQPAEEIFSDDFEDYELNAPIDQATKGWDLTKPDHMTAVANPDGSGQVAEIKGLTADPYPSLRKYVDMQAGETYAVSGKVRISDNGAGKKPSHYIELRTTPAGADEIRRIVFRIDENGISLLENMTIGSIAADEWISYTLYITPSATEVRLVAEVTGENLKNANGEDIDKIVSGATLQLANFVPASGTQSVSTIFNNGMGVESAARIYLDDIVISKGTAAPALSSNTNLASLKYTPNGGSATDVPGFAADKADYDVELPKGTTSVTISAATEDANARTIVMVSEEVKGDKVVPVSADTATEAVVRVFAQDGTTKDITLTFTVTNEEEPEPTEVLFEDNFEGYGDLTAPDTSKWDQVYTDNLKLVKDGENTYLSVFPTTECYPRLMKKDVEVDSAKTIHFSGKIMLVDGNAANQPTAQIEIRDRSGDKGKAARLLQMKTSEIKILDGPSIGTMTSDKWVNYDVYLTIGNETDAKVVVILTGEGLKNAAGGEVTELRGENTKDISSLEISKNDNKLAVMLNTSFKVASAADTSVCADDYKVAYGEAPVIPDTNLKSLTYNGVSVPNFTATTTSYTITMPTADAVAIAAEANGTGAQIEIDKPSLTPSVEGDTATITVTNGGQTTKYTVTAKLDTTANKVFNLSSASKADVQDNLVLGTGNNDGSLAYNDKNNVYYTNATSKFFEGATYIRPAKNDGAGVYSTLPYFSDKYNGKDGNPFWLEFVVSSDCRIFFADTYYNVDKTSKDPDVVAQAKPWPNMPEGWTVAAPTDDVDIMGTNFWAATENGSVYYKDFNAGDVVQIPNYGAPSYWAEDRQPWDPPVYLIVWDSDVQNPGIDDGGEPGGEGGGAEDGGEARQK